VELGRQIPQPQRPAADPQSQMVNTVLARLIHLSTAALNAESVQKAGRMIVNQIHTLVKAERAVVAPVRGMKRILCISGDLEPSQDNPFAQAVDEVRKFYQKEKEPVVVSRETLSPDMKAPALEKVLDAMGGTGILWMPLAAPGSEDCNYALWLEKWNGKPWGQEEIRLLSHAAVFFGHALSSAGKKRISKSSKKRITVMILLVLFALMWFPVHSRISAPVQVIPDRPHYVFAPFDGIVEELLVQPGEKVKKGDVIFRYDTRILEKQLEEAVKGIATARAELARLEGAAYKDEEARAKIPVQKLEIERKQGELEFIKKQLELSEVRSSADGVVVLDDPDALIGALLRTGEMAMSIASPEHTKPRMMVPVTDAGLLEKDAPVFIHLDSDPLKQIHAKVERIGFDVRLSDDRIPSVLVDGVWESGISTTPGQRGSARIQGPKTYLGLQIFRKPLMSLRTLFGI